MTLLMELAVVFVVVTDPPEGAAVTVVAAAGSADGVNVNDASILNVDG